MIIVNIDCDMMGKVWSISLGGIPGNIDCHNEFKQYTDELKKYWFNGYKYESPEGSGRIFFYRKV